MLMKLLGLHIVDRKAGLIFASAYDVESGELMTSSCFPIKAQKGQVDVPDQDL